jgi:hypothetical protein
MQDDGRSSQPQHRRGDVQCPRGGFPVLPHHAVDVGEDIAGAVTQKSAALIAADDIHVTAAAICRASAHSSPACAPSACGTEQ